MRIMLGVLVLLGILGVTVVVIYLDYGTVEPCGVLRERFRQEVVRDGGQLGGFVATAMPDTVLDGLIAAQYGALSPRHCIKLLIDGEPQAGSRADTPAGKIKVPFLFRGVYAVFSWDGERIVHQRKSLARRDLLQAVVAGAAGGLAARPAMAQQKASKSDAEYRDTPNGDQRCGGCTLYQPPQSCRARRGRYQRPGLVQALRSRSGIGVP